MQEVSGEAWARVMYASHCRGAHCMETVLAAWASHAGPPFSHASPIAPIRWDFRNMEI